MRRDSDKKVKTVEEPEDMIPTMVEVMAKPSPKPIKVGVHVKYDDKEYVVQSLKDNDEIFICMDDEEHTVKKSDVEVIR